jgi:hypothetical protein
MEVLFNADLSSVSAAGAGRARRMGAARLGSVTIANADVLPAGRTVTLGLADVPEGRLVEALLGSSARAANAPGTPTP